MKENILSESVEADKVIVGCNDLGKAAYMKLYGYSCVGRKAKVFYFEVKSTEVSEFEKTAFEYSSSSQHAFDHNIMSLKKLGEYFPEQFKSKVVAVV